MTTTEFFQEIRQLKTVWRTVGLGNKGNIRSAGVKFGLVCPISALANSKLPVETYGSCQFLQAAEFLGIDRHDAAHIANAADYPWTDLERQLRAQLIEACGLRS